MIAVAPTASGFHVGAGIGVAAPEHLSQPFSGVRSARIDALQIPQFGVVFDVDSICVNCRSVFVASSALLS
jgi:hypothetical protein